MSKYYFRDSDFEAEALSANVTGNGIILNSPGSGKSIYLLGISCHQNVILKETDQNGQVVINVGAGNYDLPATVKVDNGAALYCESNAPVSVIYHLN
jgi:hypothetical protein